MTTEAEFEAMCAMLPSRNVGRLAVAIGRPLRDVARVFVRSSRAFGSDGAFDPRDELRYNSGQTLFEFGDVVHAFGVWSSQLSLALLGDADRDLVTGDPDCRVMRLRESGDAMVQLLGLTCVDVRIWTLDDGAASDRACECAVSYCLGGGAELVYGTYLHGAADDDYLLPGHRIWRDRARACWSVARGATLSFAEYSRG